MATAEERRHQDYATEARTAAGKLWDAVNELKELQREWNAQDYGNTMPPFTEGEHEGLTAGDIGAVVNGTTDAIIAVFDAGHATNITTILPA